MDEQVAICVPSPNGPRSRREALSFAKTLRLFEDTRKTIAHPS